MVLDSILSILNCCSRLVTRMEMRHMDEAFLITTAMVTNGMGNRVFGCDDCQAICPWNKYAKATEELDFLPRHQLDNTKLVELFQWTEQEFLDRSAGSPLRRVGFERWQRNLAVGLGNAPSSPDIVNALEKTLPTTTPMVQEHIQWALEQQSRPDRRRKRKIKQ